MCESALTDTSSSSLKSNTETDISIYERSILIILERAAPYDSIATLLTGRKVKQVLFLHHNLTSALFLEDLILTFKIKLADSIF
ncbi:MAG: hypothetical protein R2942_02610 [Ignavibacteria bacterium]